MYLKSYSSLYSFLFITLILFVTVSCDSPTGNEIDTDERPEIPTMQEIEMNISYFEENQPPEGQAQDEEYAGYMEARAIAMELDEDLNGRLEELVEFLTFSVNISGGYPIQHLWTWVYIFEFDYDSEEMNDFMEFYVGVMDVDMYAQNNENDQTASWEVFVTGCVEEDEDNSSDELCVDFGVEDSDGTFELLRDHKLMDGEASLDHSTGEWNLYLPSYISSEPQYLNLVWDIESDQSKTFNTIFSFDGLLLMDLAFMENNSDYQIELLNSNEDTPLSINWDSDTGEGSLEKTGQPKVCWGSDLQETPCL